MGIAWPRGRWGGGSLFINFTPGHSPAAALLSDDLSVFDGVVMLRRLRSVNLQVEDVMGNMKHGAPYRSTLHAELSPVWAHLEWYWKCALRGWVFRYRVYLFISLPAFFVMVPLQTGEFRSKFVSLSTHEGRVRAANTGFCLSLLGV